jgi:hypothetical protein
MRIRTRLLILILVILVPAFVAAVLAVWYVYQEERVAQETSVKEAVRAFALGVDNQLETKEGILHALANSPALARGDFETFYRHVRALAPTDETAIILIGLDGRQLINTRAPLGAPLPFRRASNIDGLMKEDGADRTLVSDLFVSSIQHRHDFAIQVPVHIDGVIRYYLSMGVNAALMQALLAEQRFPAEWQATILDRRGKVVARSLDADQYRGRTVSNMALSLFAAHREGVFSNKNLAGIPVQAFYSTVPASDWKVLVSIPTADLRRVPLHAATFLATIMALLLVLSSVAGRWFARRAATPIEPPVSFFFFFCCWWCPSFPPPPPPSRSNPWAAAPPTWAPAAKCATSPRASSRSTRWRSAWPKPAARSSPPRPSWNSAWPKPWPPASAPRAPSCAARSWKPSAASRAASRTNSTTCCKR